MLWAVYSAAKLLFIDTQAETAECEKNTHLKSAAELWHKNQMSGEMEQINHDSSHGHTTAGTLRCNKVDTGSEMELSVRIKFLH